MLMVTSSVISKTFRYSVDTVTGQSSLEAGQYHTSSHLICVIRRRGFAMIGVYEPTTLDESGLDTAQSRNTGRGFLSALTGKHVSIVALMLMQGAWLMWATQEVDLDSTCSNNKASRRTRKPMFLPAFDGAAGLRTAAR